VRDDLIVLKLGGSVLPSEGGLRLAVHEVYRWRRAGRRVVCVVSALAGETDRLLGWARRLSPEPADAAVAAVASTGELQSAALLGVLLDRAGIAASVLSPAALRLRAEGPPLDATPASIDRGRLAEALDRDGVVVVPGFVGEDGSGRSVLFGRGGSDLTALFLARELGAPCRLVKDVDGLFESDPALPGPPSRRFERASFEAVLATDGTIVQHKAARFARDARVAFEVGGLGGDRPTYVGDWPSRFADDARVPRRPLRLAILGLGTVGGGVLDLVRDLPDTFDVVAVCARDAERARRLDVGHERFHSDPVRAATAGAEVVVELLGGQETARAAIAAAFDAGADVVTANKRVLAAHGAELRARAGSRRLLASAAVGGSAPILERIAARPSGAWREVRGVLNGTVNFVLDRTAAGMGLDDALSDARRRGLAELGEERDLSGLDAADKLAVIGQALGHQDLDVEVEGFGAEHLDRCRSAARRGRALRQVSRLALESSRPRASVRFEETGAEDPLHAVAGARNAVLLEARDGRSECIGGLGAGRWPTAEAVLADLLDLARGKSAVEGR
jgi:homoserine dehydrogenase